MKSRSGQLSMAAMSFLLASVLSAGCSAFSNQGGGAATSPAAPEKMTGPTSDPKLVARYDSLATQIIDTRKTEVEIVRALLESTYKDAETALARARETLRSADRSSARPALENVAIVVGYLATEGDPSVARVRKRLIEGGHHFNPLGPSGGAAGSGHHGDAAQKSAAQGEAGHHKAGEGAPPAAGAGQAPGHASDTAPAAGQAAGAQPTAGNADAGHHHAGPEAHHRSEAGHHEGSSPLIGFDPGYVVVSRAAKKTLLDASRAIARIAAAPDPAALESEWSKVKTTCVSLGIAKQ
jgi:hypothetical protein